MNIFLFAALTFDVVGKLFIAYAALRVHHRVLHEHRIDKAVFSTMKREQTFGILGVIFIIVGYLMESGILFEVF